MLTLKNPNRMEPVFFFKQRNMGYVISFSIIKTFPVEILRIMYRIELLIYENKQRIVNITYSYSGIR